MPAGTYTLSAVRAGYLTVQYGQRRPREAGRPIVLAAGQSIEKIEVAMVRGGVLAGRVLDDLGDPAPLVRVEAVEARFIRGRRVFVAARITSTNDAGEYRVSGLEPGAYQLRATSREVWESDDGKGAFVFAPTSFPGVVGSEQAQTVTVASGQEIGGLDFRLVAGPAARVTGLVAERVRRTRSRCRGQPVGHRPHDRRRHSIVGTSGYRKDRRAWRFRFPEGAGG